MKELKHILGYEILQGKVLNAIVFPVAYNFRDNLKEGGFLWGFMHENSLYGDDDFMPDKKDGFWKAYMWALRNPLHNRYYKNADQFVKDDHYKGYATGKHRVGLGMWRTYRTETGSRNGKWIDWENSLFGEQDVTFNMVFKTKTTEGYRKSYCMPKRVGSRIIVHSKRIGYENGKMQSSFNYKLFKGKENIEGYEKWKSLNWKREEI